MRYLVIGEGIRNLYRFQNEPNPLRKYHGTFHAKNVPKRTTVPAYTSLWCCLKLINRLVFVAITMICSSCPHCCCICSHRHPLIPQLGACWLAWSHTSLSIVLFIYVAELFLVHIRQKTDQETKGVFGSDGTFFVGFPTTCWVESGGE